MSARLWPAYHWCVVVALMPVAAGAQPCLVVEDDKLAPDVAAPEVDVRQVVRLTPAGDTALETLGLRFAYLEIVREATRATVDGNASVMAEEKFIRLLDGRPRQTQFKFSRHGRYTLRAFGSSTFAWPAPASLGTDLRCDPLKVDVGEALQRSDFTGVRGQWWGAYRVPAGLEAGGSVFFGRLGVALSAELAVLHAIGPRDDPDNVNPVVGSFELRWRGARGYLGGGVRYYPDDEPNRDHLRFVFVAAEELPSFRGRPIWLLLDIRLEEPQKNFLKGLRPAFGVRFDLWGSRP